MQRALPRTSGERRCRAPLPALHAGTTAAQQPVPEPEPECSGRLSPAVQAEIKRWGEVWALCMRAYVGRLPDLPPRVDELLTLEEAAELRAARKARHFALQQLRSVAVEARRGLPTAEVRAC